jgi:hypothetical protein
METQEKRLARNIKEAGLLKIYVATKLGISSAHLSMMFNGSTPMPEDVRNKITSIINQAMKITA